MRKNKAKTGMEAFWERHLALRSEAADIWRRDHPGLVTLQNYVLYQDFITEYVHAQEVKDLEAEKGGGVRTRKTEV